MIQIDELIWYVDGPVVRWITMPFPTRMVLVRLQKGGLFVHSPVRLTDGLKDAVTRLGDPMFIVSPNRLHHIFLPEWQTAFPDAKIFSPPGLAQRKPEVEFFSELRDTPEPEWAGDVDQLIFRGSRVLDEVVFFHKPSATLILGDLIENFDPQTLGPFHRILARLAQIVAPRGRTPFDF